MRLRKAASSSLEDELQAQAATNSSPPKRAHVALAEDSCANACPTVEIAISPSACPYVSFMVLRPFRSADTRTKGVLVFAHCSNSGCTRW